MVFEVFHKFYLQPKRKLKECQIMQKNAFFKIQEWSTVNTRWSYPQQIRIALISLYNYTQLNPAYKMLLKYIKLAKVKKEKKQEASWVDTKERKEKMEI